MEEKGVSSIVVLFPSLFCAVLLSVLLVSSVDSNPIPVNTDLLWLQSENITIDVSFNDGEYIAEVEGVYPFKLEGSVRLSRYDDHKSVLLENWEEILEDLRMRATGEMIMMFPVPPNAGNISVRVYGKNIEWEWADNEFLTELGNFPMIKWTFSIPEDRITTDITDGGETEVKWGKVSSEFTLAVEYTHSIPLENGKRVLLYTLGTGMYLGAYNWFKSDTAAYIETKLPEEVEIIGAEPESNIDEETNRIITTCQLGHGTGDYVVEFTVTQPPLNLSLDKTIYHPGELMIIAIKNVSDNQVTLDISGAYGLYCEKKSMITGYFIPMYLIGLQQVGL